uniref:Centriole, cilia and spindle associated protein n=1 Tax=Accipiter nisus TaxID=211598 RepID=A0A8B9NHW8_9AVES
MVVPARRVKTEYMKRFKEPKWESCGACYLELLRYRLSRRLLEQAHRPWLWDGWEEDSGGGGGASTAGSPSPPGLALPALGCGGVRRAPGRAVPAGGRRRFLRKAGTAAGVRPCPPRSEGKPERRGARGGVGARSSRPKAMRSAKSPQKTDAPKENKHPFALYGWGERQTDTGSQKTHNVCASASASEIHESALRAKNRRQVEKRKLSQRRVRSAEAEKAWRIKPSPPDNPWMTEYMRCYSARAR